MKKHEVLIDNIPAVLWGENNRKLFVAVHGNMSHKNDIPISILAEETVPLGYQVLSFDLPQHGDRIMRRHLAKFRTVSATFVR